MRVLIQALFLFILFWSPGAISQTSHTLTLYFEINTHTLSPENLNRIDSVINRLNNTASAYEVEIEGHSDTTGQFWLNQSISQKRARETLRYLKSKGFSQKSITTSGKGSSEPIDVNTTETGKAHNRRVTLVIHLNLPDITNLGGISLTPEKFTMAADSGGVFFDTSGTVIKIPPDAFVDENGQPVTGNIDFSYTEYRDPVDLILSSISMQLGTGNNRAYFNSYGMFRLLAYHNGKPVFLKDNKKAEIDFAMDRWPEYADIFRYDSLSKKWEKPEIVKNINWHVYGPICGGSGGEGGGAYNDCYCRMNDCPALDFLIKTIQDYTGSERSLYADFMKKDSLGIFETVDSLEFYYQLCPQIAYRLDTIAKRLKIEAHIYKITNVKLGLRRVKFSIKCQSRRSNELIPLKTIRWKYPISENRGAYLKIDKYKWTFCRIDRNEAGFSIQLSDSSETLELTGVKAVTKKHMPANEKKAFIEKQYSDYELLRAPYHKRMKDLIELKPILNHHRQFCGHMQDSLSRRLRAYYNYYCLLKRDSLLCFWNINSYFMPLDEKKLLFTRWLRYFDAHKDEMEARVVQVRNNDRYLSCLQRTQNGKFKLGQLPDKPVRPVFTETLGTISISAIAKIHDTVQVYASYTDADGNNLEPVILYLTDKSINTVIRYDGTDKYGPYKFPISPTTVKAMLAIDKSGNTYICSPEHLRSIVVSGRGLTHTFVLKKIQKIKNKQELLNLLEYDPTYGRSNQQTEAKTN